MLVPLVLLGGAIFVRGAIDGGPRARAARPIAPLGAGVLPPAPVAAPTTAPVETTDESSDEDGGGALVMPTGNAPRLTCTEARKIVAQARSLMASPSGPIDPARFATAASDWLDPHGLWSVAPDAPVAQALASRASDLVSELESDTPASCASAEEVGGILQTWVGSLRKTALDAERLARAARPLPSGPHAAWDVLSATPFEDGTIERRGHDLARLIGHGAGTIEGLYGDELTPYARAAVERTVPDLDAKAWSEVLLAAEVRAYLPQMDPHGAWAPIDEETSIYDMSLEVDPPDQLWTDMTRTTAGVRIDRGAKPPLHDGDVVLEAQGIKLAGLSVEQASQVAMLPSGVDEEVVVVRSPNTHPQKLTMSGERADVPRTAADPSALESRRVIYGDGFVDVISIPDVPDDLGDRLGDAIREAKKPSAPSNARRRPRPAGSPAVRQLTGVVLDLRGNGGGSTDGAIAGVGLFIPGAPMFPMRRRDGGVEVDRAPIPTPEDAWTGPLAVLVDGDSASAAEMIAGAIEAYHRGVLIGSHTYGKGCAQEYLDDDAQRGVLRLTTLLFSLPDGSPLQRVGLDPQIALGAGAGAEREAFLPHSLDSWRGPDVRDRALVHDVPWPSSGGHIGPCADETICRALRALGSSPAAAR